MVGGHLDIERRRSGIDVLRHAHGRGTDNFINGIFLTIKTQDDNVQQICVCVIYFGHGQ